MVGCVIIPVPVEHEVIAGKQFSDSELAFVQLGKTTRHEAIDYLGNPTIWLTRQRILVYGLRRVETGALWFIGGGLSGAGGLLKGEAKEAVYLVFDDKDVVTHWGRSQVKRGETWLSGATEWADSEGIKISEARDHFFEETPSTKQSLIYFYRPRDYQYFLPLVPPAKKIPAGIASYADVFQDGLLVGQIRWQCYVVVRASHGSHSFMVNTDTDDVVNPETYRSATIRLDIAPESVTFVDVGIRAGYGAIEPILVNRARGDAITVIKGFRECW